MKNEVTKAIRTQIKTTHAKEHSTPLYLTSSFTFDDSEEMRAAFADEIERPIYSRFSNPNCDEFIEKICLMEETEAGYATASGMAAIFATFAAFCKSGDNIVSCKSVFGATHTILTKILPKWNISTTYVDVNADKNTWLNAINNNTRLLYIECPTNPGIDILDLEMLGEICRQKKILYVVDNCFATPCLQKPVRYGADLIIHSATKFIDGQGRVNGGIVTGKKEYIKEIYNFCRSTGPALSPFNAWILSKSLETLSLRMEKHSQNALITAQYLAKETNKITSVKYPFLPSHPKYQLATKQMKAGGALISFELKQGLSAGQKFLNALRLCSLTANLGDTRTIITHPASTTHAKLTPQERAETGITEGLIRISVGLEDVDDIIGDIQQALDKI